MKVTFHLAALTRQFCDIEKEIPDDTTDAELDAMARLIRTEADGSDYVSDNEYWEEQPARWEKERCHCIVKHANTLEDRKYILKRIAYCETINDDQGITMMRLQLDNEQCPARPSPEARKVMDELVKVTE